MIDVIVPVYRDQTTTMRCLTSVLTADAGEAYELIVVDDATPEPELAAQLDTLAGQGRIRLLRHAENRGFVASVNHGMALHPERDVVLLNSDTEVNGDWLRRLARCARSDARIGTVTPFSNNATICSYPRFCEDNPLPPGRALAEVDRAFAQACAGLVHDLPTAVGFCMFIRRACLAEVGPFDEQRFGRGYGEENDFSLRAAVRGWRNVLCGDVFVYHVGSVSFSEERHERMRAAGQTMRELHPDYDAKVAAFIAADPLAPCRQRVTQILEAPPAPPARPSPTRKPLLTLADAYDRGDDNFLLLRLLAAMMVIYGHSYAIVGDKSGDVLVRANWGTYSGAIAVDMFFVISGFLVTGSAARRANVWSFLKARFLRLMPAYLVCLVSTAFLIGSIATTEPLGSYLRHPETLVYVYGNLGLRELHWTLPGVFKTHPHQTLNGSIWTLPAEASMYLWLAAMVLAGAFKRVWLAAAGVAALVLLGAMNWQRFPMLLVNDEFARFAALFAVGAVAFLVRRFIPIHGLIAAGLVFAAYMARPSPVFQVLLGAAEAYFCFWFAYAWHWRAFNRFGDYSYGVYLWGWPSQQVAYALLGATTANRLTVVAAFIALALGIASWHFIERPALALKDKRLPWQPEFLKRVRARVFPSPN